MIDTAPRLGLFKSHSGRKLLRSTQYNELGTGADQEGGGVDPPCKKIHVLTLLGLDKVSQTLHDLASSGRTSDHIGSDQIRYDQV